MIKNIYKNITGIIKIPRIYFGKSISEVPEGSILLFPYTENVFCCGIACIAAFKRKSSDNNTAEYIKEIAKLAKKIESRENVELLVEKIKLLRTADCFFDVFNSPGSRKKLADIAEQINTFINLNPQENEIISETTELLQDAVWFTKNETLDNIKKVEIFLNGKDTDPLKSTIEIFQNINSVLNSIDRLEVRGRDSAGMSILLVFEQNYEDIKASLKKKNLLEIFEKRLDTPVLLNNSISLNKNCVYNGNKYVSLALTYKIAAEIGKLGDNVKFLRDRIAEDRILYTLLNLQPEFYTISSHTRWASMGAITESNCHPLDNRITEALNDQYGIIHVSLNGDIDNFQELKKESELTRNITTDTKIIPLRVEMYLKRGFDIEEAFRLAVSDFKGSHAISMHTDYAPGKIFLAQKGSGQAMFVGIAEDHFMPASEVYGFVEQTSCYLKLNGQGQIFILDTAKGKDVSGIKAFYYDGTKINPTQNDVRQTKITSRDIDRRSFPHYFLKEISESAQSVKKTLQNRWKLKKDKNIPELRIDQKTFPERIEKAFSADKIKRIYLIGQGTAGVAALACADIIEYYLNDSSIHIAAAKASEFSGFKLSQNSMSDTLIIAISQSGTTADTNRAVAMAKKRGAYAIAIVNRRDSDITFKVDGVMYTSGGRDIEMSVASTKAFYSQIIAGAIIGLNIAKIKNKRTDRFIADEINNLLEIPAKMKKILKLSPSIRACAEKTAFKKIYWAVVGSGPNKAAADEIRIKLSELCYKTISSDYVEDKKHIDLSSEPLIIVCAAGTRDTVIQDIIKDAAIFSAHKAVPIVIADEGEQGFEPYSQAVFYVPETSEHLAPILNTFVGHLWGYYAALTINKGSEFLYQIRERLQNIIDQNVASGTDVFELITKRYFKEEIIRMYESFIRERENGVLEAMDLKIGSNLMLLFKYAASKLPSYDFKLDFGKEGTAQNMLDTFFRYLGDGINHMTRPIDAIKHQAKTVTVGTSRISGKVQGIIFDVLSHSDIPISQITTSNIIIIRNLQEVISEIKGTILYKVNGLDILGEPTEQSTITIIQKNGILKDIPSRVETDSMLKGTKRIIVKEKNVYIGKGKNDERIILIIPIISGLRGEADHIEKLLLCYVKFKEQVPLQAKVEALGGKYEKIKDYVQESTTKWKDEYLELLSIEELFGLNALSAWKRIVERTKT